MLDDCDSTGIWKGDFELAEFFIGENLSEWKEYFNGRIEKFGEKYFIPKFIEFQYGTLNPENRAHKSVLDKLKKHKNKGLIRSLEEAKDKDKDKDKEKDKEKKHKHGEFKNVFLSDNEYQKLENKLGIDGRLKWVGEVDKAIEKYGYKYKSHYLVILDWSRKEVNKLNEAREISNAF